MRKLQASAVQLRAAAGVAAVARDASPGDRLPQNSLWSYRLEQPVLPRGGLAAAAALARHRGGWAALADSSIITSTSRSMAANRRSKSAPAGVPSQMSGPRAD